MAIASKPNLRFIPSAVDGLPTVTELSVFPDRLELVSEEKPVTIRFLDIAQWHRCGWLYRPLSQLTGKVRGWPSVADRDWFHPPSRRFFRFYTHPPITVFLPGEPRETTYEKTLFRRVQDVIIAGGFSTNDLG